MRTGLVRGVVIGVIVALVVIVGGIFALFGWAHASGEELQKNFFAAVLSGDANRVTALMDPALAAEFDEPMLAQVDGRREGQPRASSERTQQDRLQHVLERHGRRAASRRPRARWSSRRARPPRN